ncbi:hypothetical protein K4A83_14765, partial [Spirulina subsalsa FACHB-351]
GKLSAQLLQIVLPSSPIIHPISNGFVADELNCPDRFVDCPNLLGFAVGFKLKYNHGYILPSGIKSRPGRTGL